MTKIDLRKPLLDVMQENGIYCSGQEKEPIEMDSLTYMSVLSTIEQELCVRIPDEMLLTPPESFEDFLEMVSKIYN